MSNSSRILNQNLSAVRPETKSAQARTHDHKHGPDCDHDHEENRDQNRSLVRTLGSAAATQAHEMVKSKGSQLIKNQLAMFILPIRQGVQLIEAIPVVGSVVGTFESWLANNMQAYIDRTGINFGMPVHEAIDKLLRGDIDEFSGDFTNSIYNFAKSAIPAQVTEAFSSGNPMKIASALTSTVSENASSLATQMNNPSIQGNFITRPLKYIASFIPFVNKAPEWLKPVIGGGVAYMGLGFVWRTTKSLFKWIVGGAALFLGWKFFMGGKAADPSQSAALKAKLKVA